MEKSTAHYDLAIVQADVKRLGAAAFTRSAIDGGRQLGLTLSEMLSVIQALRRGCLYKSMTTYADHKLWQDVYHYSLPNGKTAYIKVTRRDDGPPVISFKEKTT